MLHAEHNVPFPKKLHRMPETPLPARHSCGEKEKRGRIPPPSGPGSLQYFASFPPLAAEESVIILSSMATLPVNIRSDYDQPD